jgi:hypothetical protein
METITIEVEREIAKAYQNSSSTERQKIQLTFNVLFKQIMNTRSLEDIIQEMQTQAKANGLTPKILDEILQDSTSQTKRQPRISGQDKGKIFISQDFNAPLPDDILADFMG